MVRSICLYIVLSILPITVWAGSQAQQQQHYSAERISKFAKDVEHYAAKQGAHAFIIGRVGRAQSELPKGIKFTHTAIAVYSSIQLTDGETAYGYAIHNLYQTPDNMAVSELVTDYPVDFFWGAHSLKAGIIIPDIKLQQRLIEMIHNGKDRELHNPNYSVLANPFNGQFQNCTEYTLDLINAAIYHTQDSQRLKANAQAYFKPQPIHVSKFKLAMGALVTDGLSTRDHKGKIATATFSSIYRYLDTYDLASHGVIFSENGNVAAL